MCHKNFSDINYQNIPSIAHNLYKNSFLRMILIDIINTLIMSRAVNKK